MNDLECTRLKAVCSVIRDTTQVVWKKQAVLTAEMVPKSATVFKAHRLQNPDSHCKSCDCNRLSAIGCQGKPLVRVVLQQARHCLRLMRLMEATDHIVSHSIRTTTFASKGTHGELKFEPSPSTSIVVQSGLESRGIGSTRTCQEISDLSLQNT